MKIEVVKGMIYFTPTSSYERADILKYSSIAQMDLGVSARVGRILAIAMLAEEIHKLKFSMTEVHYDGQSFSIYPKGLSGICIPEVVVNP